METWKIIIWVLLIIIGLFILYIIFDMLSEKVKNKKISKFFKNIRDFIDRGIDVLHWPY